MSAKRSRAVGHWECSEHWIFGCVVVVASTSRPELSAGHLTLDRLLYENKTSCLSRNSPRENRLRQQHVWTEADMAEALEQLLTQEKLNVLETARSQKLRCGADSPGRTKPPQSPTSTSRTSYRSTSSFWPNGFAGRQTKAHPSRSHSFWTAPSTSPAGGYTAVGSIVSSTGTRTSCSGRCHRSTRSARKRSTARSSPTTLRRSGS